MKRIADTLGLARSNIAERVKGVRPKRGPQTRDGDLELAAEIRRLVDARPTYGYRRIAALLKRKRRADGMASVNAKRVYRLMKRHGLLLARHTGRRRPREHDGQVATLRSNIRWCSDGLAPLPRLLSLIAGCRTTTPCIRIPGWATAHRGNTSCSPLNPPRVRFNGVNSTPPQYCVARSAECLRPVSASCCAIGA